MTCTTKEAENNAYVTLVMKGSNYTPGALVLAESLIKVGAKYPRICMVTPDVEQTARDALAKQFTRVIEVPYISKKSVKMISAKQNNMYGGWIEQSYTKWNILDPAALNCGELPIDPQRGVKNAVGAEYDGRSVPPIEAETIREPQGRRSIYDNSPRAFDKVLFVDADIVFLSNCDHLFRLDAPAMTFSSPWARPYRRGGITNPYGELRHGSKVNSKQIYRGFKSIVGVGSMVLVRPDIQAFAKLNEILARDEIYGHAGCVSGVDEQSLAEIYLSMGQEFTHIHQQYNWLVGKTNWLLNGENPSVYHYYNTKPWEQRGDEWPDLQVWFDLAAKVADKSPDLAVWFNRKIDS